jgi:hypothetical protein
MEIEIFTKLGAVKKKHTTKNNLIPLIL